MEVLFLTRRNLQTLINKLNRNKWEGGDPSQCMIIKSDTVHPKYPMKRETAIKAIENEEYYTDRDPGIMHPSDTPFDMDKLKGVLEHLSGPNVWGALNHGQMQCSQCSTAYTGLEDAIAELKELCES